MDVFDNIITHGEIGWVDAQVERRRSAGGIKVLCSTIFIYLFQNTSVANISVGYSPHSSMQSKHGDAITYTRNMVQRHQLNLERQFSKFSCLEK